MAKAIQVNTVTDDLFELAFPPGTNVQDLVANKSYLVPHGEHLLDDAIARANPIIDGEVKPFRSGAGFRSIWRQLLILNVAALIVAGGGVFGAAGKCAVREGGVDSAPRGGSFR